MPAPHEAQTARPVKSDGPFTTRGGVVLGLFCASFVYRLARALMGTRPYAAVQATTFHLLSYAEAAISGGNQFALTYAAHTATNVRSELGIRTDKSFAALRAFCKNCATQSPCHRFGILHRMWTSNTLFAATA
jgi:hypothetical protein